MKKKKRKSIILRFLVLCISGYLLFTLVGLWNSLAEKRTQLAYYEGQIEHTARQISEYKDLLASGNEKKIIEKAAREKLGYVYADEQVYIDISGN